MSKSKMEIEIEELGIENSAGFKNIIAIRDYSKTTRQLCRDTSKEVDELKNQVLTQKEIIVNLKSQISFLQAKVLGGAATTQ